MAAEDNESQIQIHLKTKQEQYVVEVLLLFIGN